MFPYCLTSHSHPSSSLVYFSSSLLSFIPPSFLSVTFIRQCFSYGPFPSNFVLLHFYSFFSGNSFIPGVAFQNSETLRLLCLGGPHPVNTLPLTYTVKKCRSPIFTYHSVPICDQLYSLDILLLLAYDILEIHDWMSQFGKIRYRATVLYTPVQEV